MESDEIRVELSALADFHDRLAPRLPEVSASVSVLVRSDGPALGDFHHAKQLRQRYEALHADFVGRVKRLLSAMVVAEAGTGAIVGDYQNNIDQATVRLRALADALTQSDVVHRHNVLSEAGLDATLFQDAARYEASVTPPAPGTVPVAGGDGGPTRA